MKKCKTCNGFMMPPIQSLDECNKCLLAEYKQEQKNHSQCDHYQGYCIAK